MSLYKSRMGNRADSELQSMSIKAKTIWILSSTLALLISTSCQAFSLRNEEVVRRYETYYLITPDTILDDITNGTTDVFRPSTATPQPALSQSLSTVRWSQRDYLSIAEALHQFVWRKSAEDWNIRYMLFSLNCRDVGKGPQSAYFIFYKVIENNREKERFEYQVHIDQYLRQK